MYKHSFFLLTCLTVTAATAVAQDDAYRQPVVVQVTANSSQPPVAAIETTDFDRYLLKLKAQREALANEQDAVKKQFPEGVSWEGGETAKLRAQLGQLITQFGGGPDAKKGKAPGMSPLPLPPLMPGAGQGGGPAALDNGKKGDSKLPLQAAHPNTTPKETSETGPAADPLALGHVLFKAGNWELALKAYRMVNTAALKADERAPIQYMMAACLRKMGKLDEAAAIYRDVANVRGDDQVAACAQWQLVQLRWQSEFEAQLKDVRQRRKALEASK
ncbi:MAG TPA: tetratricopeptide repeat protein [Gemmataceae bacterium]|nr:tetratricopeptide repeat protein [Gemmataceae bacterium]